MQQLCSSSIVNWEENHATCESFSEKLKNVHNSMMLFLGGKYWKILEVRFTFSILYKSQSFQTEQLRGAGNAYPGNL